MACPLGRKAAPDDAAVAAAPAEAVGPAALASNEADVKRYAADEKPLGSEKSAVKNAPAKALKSVPKGDLVASLAAGVEVVELAEHDGFFLVTFAAPTDPSKHLMGWVVRQAFTAPRAAAKKPPTVAKCGGGQVLVFTDLKGEDEHPACHKACENDKECSAGQDCESAQLADPATGNPASPRDFASVCISQSSSSAIDILIEAPLAGSKCPPGLTQTVGPFCNRPCSNDGDCFGKGRCASFESLGGKKFCQAKTPGAPVDAGAAARPPSKTLLITMTASEIATEGCPSGYQQPAGAPECRIGCKTVATCPSNAKVCNAEQNGSFCE